MGLLIPGTYESSGQQLGETRQEMTRDLMQKDLQPIIDKLKDKRDKYYILVHAKPWPNKPNVIKKKILVMERKPPMMLSCILFGVDNIKGDLTIEWCLPGSWPTWACEGKNEPIPETIASLKELHKQTSIDNILAY